MFSLESLRLRRDSQERPPVYICADCRCEIYEGDEYWLIAGERLCSECIELCRFVAGEE